MFFNPTVFIIGAGANHECGMPLGGDLKARITHAVDFRFEDFGKLKAGDADLLEILRHHYGKDAKKYISAGQDLARVLPGFISIDEGLHYFSGRPEIIELGKALVVYLLLQAEKESSFAYGQTGRPNVRNENAWYEYFLSMALAGLRREEITSIFESTVVVDFNYDRTLEHYLYWALQSQANASADEAATAIKGLQIIRPYGSVGPLDWQKPGGTRFGAVENLHIHMFSLSTGIQTYTEQLESNVPRQLGKAFGKAEAVVILGFGFHSQNMQLLMEEQTGLMETGLMEEATQVFATGFKIDHSNYPLIKSRLIECFGSTEVTLLDKTSHTLLRDLRLSILNAAS